MDRYYHNVRHADLLQITRALLKFCRDHEYGESGLALLSACVDALETDDFSTALNHFKAIPFGGMSCFNDWLPVAVYEHEDDDYVQVVFDALLERCIRMMRTAAGDPEPRKPGPSLFR